MEALACENHSPVSLSLQNKNKNKTKTVPKMVPLLKTFKVRYFKKCDKLITQFIMLLLLVSPVLCESSQEINSSDVQTAAASGKLFSDKSDIFFNATFVNTQSNICLKDHVIKARDLREEENVKLRREKDKKSGNVWDGEESEDLGYDSSRESYDTAGGCSSCDKDSVRIKSLESIKESILSKLGMSQPPNVKDRPKPKISDEHLMMLLSRRQAHHGSNGLYWVVQDKYWEMMQGDEPYDSRFSDKVNSKNTDSYRSSFLRSHGNASEKYSDSSEFQEGEVSVEEEDNFHAKTERIVAFSQTHPKIRHLPHVQYFEFSDRVRMSRVKRALLWVYIKGRENASLAGNKISISVYKILDAGKAASNGSREVPIISSVRADSTQFFPNGTGAWITMEYVQIKNLVSEWFKYPQHNCGIVIRAEDSNRTNNLAVTSHDGADTAYLPFLELYVTDNRKRRTKRMVGLNCKDSSKETRCCRYPLRVDFVEFGWDWVIAPKRYDAFYCAGECPLSFLPQHLHTHVSQLANTRGNGPCCAPRKLSELQMLYFDNNMNIIFGRLPAMRVDICGCT